MAAIKGRFLRVIICNMALTGKMPVVAPESEK